MPMPPATSAPVSSLAPPADALGATKHVRIDLGDRSYDIAIGGQLLGNPATYARVPAAAMALIVTNTTVKPLYAQQLASALAGRSGAGMTKVVGRLPSWPLARAARVSASR